MTELRVSRSRSKWLLNHGSDQSSRRWQRSPGSPEAEPPPTADLLHLFAAAEPRAGGRPRRLVREERAASLRPAAAPPIDFSVNCVGTRKTHKCCISSQTFAPPALDGGVLCVADLFIFVYTWILVCNLIPRKLSGGTSDAVQHPGKVVQAFICQCIWLLGGFF